MAGWSVSRRALLTGRRTHPLRRTAPPGATDDGLAACTGCGACADACPTAIITLADAKPSLDFTAGECLLCGECARACPEPVFDRAAAPSFPHVAAISDACLARAGVACMTCRDACPEQAIRLRPRIGGPFLPEVTEADCSGCGACIAPCPARAISVTARAAETMNA